ncbi:MAG TPA: aminotransferase class IV [Gemmatimonadales bacterium]|nr:aminotransferase class IV [Gemmatimonadales bacterium]
MSSVDGLIETVRVRMGRAPLWPLHAARLARSAAALGLDLPPVTAPSGGADRIVRIVARPGGAEIEERAVSPAAPIDLVFSRVPHLPYPHKMTARARFDGALREAEQGGAGEPLLVTEAGWVAECARWALFWWEGERLAAPPLTLGILPSVARARIEALVGGIVERRVTRETLPRRGLFLANAARGIVEVASLHGETAPPEARTAALAAHFWP